MTKKALLTLIVITLLGSVLRLYKLGENPPGLTWDEAALGYNAFSLLHTARDEYGKFLPLTLQSFGDYKPALYAYAAIPPVAVFGLNEFAVRFPSAVFGIIAIILTFFITRRMLENEWLAVVCAFVVAFSPWHMQFSRGGWEANMALTLILFGLLFLLKGLEKPPWFIGAVSFFSLSLYTYQSSRLFVPLFVVAFLVIYRRQLFPLRAWHIATIALGLLLVIPFLFTIANQKARSRLSVQSLFSYSRPDAETAALTSVDNVSSSSATFRLFHSQKELWGRAIIERELMYLSPSYLFVTGDQSLRHRPPNVAHGYWIDIPFYLLGFYVLARSNLRHKSLLIAWLLLAPLPAVLSRDSTTALRSLQLVFAVDVLIALGLWLAWQKIKLWRYAWLLIACFTIIFLYNFLFYLDSYYVHMPKRNSEYWLTGYKQVIERISKTYNYFDQVVFTTDYNEPYIFVLFYLGIDPHVFQNQAKLSQTRGIDVGEVERFNNFTFRHIYWPDDRSKPKTLFIGTEEELPEKDIVSEPRAQLLDTVRFANGRVAFKIVETK